MDDALAQWLALREPTDAASRAPQLTQLIANRFAGRDPLHVLDLGSGTGSNIRYLADHLPARHQRWLAVDRSPLLLSLARSRTEQATAAMLRLVEIDTREQDLNELPQDLFAGRHLVTSSALLDLVSESWLTLLAQRCREAGAAALFTIVYNGRSEPSPHDPDDALVIALFNRHQHRDKGLGGPAAGPDATDAAVRAFTAAGYDVETAGSDWRLGPDDREIQRELIEGWAFAATETDPRHAERIAAWRARRLEHLDAGRAHAIVGHHDIAAVIR
jgi:SAM-dependent methyltransferase